MRTSASHTETPPVSPDLWAAFLDGSRRACAQLITRVENDPSLLPALKDALGSRLGKAVRIGITGPPGVGKSTLCSALAHGLAEAGHRVGIVAVDPSSPFTGGAFMGDRVRMDRLAGDDRIFVRSLASREGRGGLSPATPGVVDVLEGFGMDRILIETVGVGQAELDVMDCADMVVLVLQPSTGDAIQTLKAGIIEAADLIVVNKSDLPGVDTVLQSLRFLFSLSGPRRGKPAPPLIPTSAQQTQGIENLVSEVGRLATTLVESGSHRVRKQARLKDEMRTAIQRQLWEDFLSLTSAGDEIDRTAGELARTGGSPYPFVRQVCSRIQMTLREAKHHEPEDH
ncbi:MAG: methylmalonyl Co-A mutase-associated GTPase MeaB [Fimbriimonadaceae bacterium]|nr:methylmalonyl Co-A mutase-associated GTPase MeaB [Fimbriimonadaceae bacterium]